MSVVNPTQFEDEDDDIGAKKLFSTLVDSDDGKIYLVFSSLEINNVRAINIVLPPRYISCI